MDDFIKIIIRFYKNNNNFFFFFFIQVYTYVTYISYYIMDYQNLIFLNILFYLDLL